MLLNGGLSHTCSPQRSLLKKSSSVLQYQEHKAFLPSRLAQPSRVNTQHVLSCIFWSAKRQQYRRENHRISTNKIQASISLSIYSSSQFQDKIHEELWRTLRSKDDMPRSFKSPIVQSQRAPRNVGIVLKLDAKVKRQKM